MAFCHKEAAVTLDRDYMNSDWNGRPSLPKGSETVRMPLWPRAESHPLFMFALSSMFFPKEEKEWA